MVSADAFIASEILFNLSILSPLLAGGTFHLGSIGTKPPRGISADQRARSYLINRAHHSTWFDRSTIPYQDVRQNATGRRTDLMSQIIGIDLDQRLIDADWIPNALEPSPD